MKTVWKYEFEISDSVQEKDIPCDGEIVHCGPQSGLVCIWVLGDPKCGLQSRQFVVHGTGHPVAAHESYIGTVMMLPLVWHLFERKCAMTDRIDEEARRAAIEIDFFSTGVRRENHRTEKMAALITAAYAERIKSERISAFREAAQLAESFNDCDEAVMVFPSRIRRAIEALAEKEAKK